MCVRKFTLSEWQWIGIACSLVVSMGSITAFIIIIFCTIAYISAQVWKRHKWFYNFSYFSQGFLQWLLQTSYMENHTLDIWCYNFHKGIIWDTILADCLVHWLTTNANFNSKDLYTEFLECVCGSFLNTDPCTNKMPSH